MSNSTLSKKLASVKPGTLFVGVDLALDRNVAVVLTERAEQLARFGFPNEREGYDYFYRHLEAIQERQRNKRSPCHIHELIETESRNSPSHPNKDPHKNTQLNEE